MKIIEEIKLHFQLQRLVKATRKELNWVLADIAKHRFPYPWYHKLALKVLKHCGNRDYWYATKILKWELDHVCSPGVPSKWDHFHDQNHIPIYRRDY